MALKETETGSEYPGEGHEQLNQPTESVDSSICEVWGAGSWGQGMFGNPEEEVWSPLKATAKQRLVKTKTTLCILSLQGFSDLRSVLFGETVLVRYLFVISACSIVT
jgi:hypothetical protein